MPSLPADAALPALVVLFGLSGSAVVAAGIALARNGDAIAERTGLGGFLVGMILLAGATSLPEIATDVSAALADAPDLAVGDLFGSSMANMAILAIVDVVYRGRVWARVGLDQARLAAVAIALTSIALLGILVPRSPALGWVGLPTVAMVAVYLAAATWIRRSRGKGRPARDTSGEWIAPVGVRVPAMASLTLRAIGVRFGLAAAVVLIAAPVVALSAKGIADETGIGQSFVGVFLLAATTSLPELVGSFTALRIGAHDLAVGNLFGSNAFNMTIFVILDAVHAGPPILGIVSPMHVISALAAVLLMAIGIAALVYRTQGRLALLEPSSMLIIIGYVVALALLL